MAAVYLLARRAVTGLPFECLHSLVSAATADGFRPPTRLLKPCFGSALRQPFTLTSTTAKPDLAFNHHRSTPKNYSLILTKMDQDLPESYRMASDQMRRFFATVKLTANELLQHHLGLTSQQAENELGRLLEPAFENALNGAMAVSWTIPVQPDWLLDFAARWIWVMACKWLPSLTNLFLAQSALINLPLVALSILFDLVQSHYFYLICMSC